MNKREHQAIHKIHQHLRSNPNTPQNDEITREEIESFLEKEINKFTNVNKTLDNSYDWKWKHDLEDKFTLESSEYLRNIFENQINRNFEHPNLKDGENKQIHYSIEEKTDLNNQISYKVKLQYSLREQVYEKELDNVYVINFDSSKILTKENFNNYLQNIDWVKANYENPNIIPTNARVLSVQKREENNTFTQSLEMKNYFIEIEYNGNTYLSKKFTKSPSENSINTFKSVFDKNNQRFNENSPLIVNGELNTINSFNDLKNTLSSNQKILSDETLNFLNFNTIEKTLEKFSFEIEKPETNKIILKIKPKEINDVNTPEINPIVIEKPIFIQKEETEQDFTNEIENFLSDRENALRALIVNEDLSPETKWVWNYALENIFETKKNSFDFNSIKNQEFNNQRLTPNDNRRIELVITKETTNVENNKVKYNGKIVFNFRGQEYTKNVNNLMTLTFDPNKLISQDNFETLLQDDDWVRENIDNENIKKTGNSDYSVRIEEQEHDYYTNALGIKEKTIIVNKTGVQDPYKSKVLLTEMSEEKINEFKEKWNQNNSRTRTNPIYIGTEVGSIPDFEALIQEVGMNTQPLDYLSTIQDLIENDLATFLNIKDQEDFITGFYTFNSLKENETQMTFDLKISIAPYFESNDQGKIFPLNAQPITIDTPIKVSFNDDSNSGKNNNDMVNQQDPNNDETENFEKDNENIRVLNEMVQNKVSTFINNLNSESFDLNRQYIWKKSFVKNNQLMLEQSEQFKTKNLFNPELITLPYPERIIENNRIKWKLINVQERDNKLYGNLEISYLYKSDDREEWITETSTEEITVRNYYLMTEQKFNQLIRTGDFMWNNLKVKPESKNTTIGQFKDAVGMVENNETLTGAFLGASSTGDPGKVYAAKISNEKLDQFLDINRAVFPGEDEDFEAYINIHYIPRNTDLLGILDYTISTRNKTNNSNTADSPIHSQIGFKSEVKNAWENYFKLNKENNFYPNYEGEAPNTYNLNNKSEDFKKLTDKVEERDKTRTGIRMSTLSPLQHKEHLESNLRYVVNLENFSTTSESNIYQGTISIKPLEKTQNDLNEYYKEKIKYVISEPFKIKKVDKVLTPAEKQKAYQEKYNRCAQQYPSTQRGRPNPGFEMCMAQ